MCPLVLAIVPKRPIVTNAVLPIGTFLVVCSVGVLGFVWLENISVIEAMFWLLDPTSIELHGVDDTVRAFAVVVFLGLILSALWIGETVIGTAFGGQIQEEIKRVYTERHIEDLTDHVIICGYGIFGRTIASTLSNAGMDVVVIERDDHHIEDIRSEDLIAIHGDARFEETLQDAGIQQAKMLVAAIDDSSANIEISIITDQITPDLRTIVRVGNDRYSTLARRSGADDVIIPEITSGQHVSQAISNSLLER